MTELHLQLNSHKILEPTYGLQPARLLRPWDFPGKSTGVGCHCLLFVSSGDPPGELRESVPHSCADGWLAGGRHQCWVSPVLPTQGVVIQNAFSHPISPTNCYPPLVLMVSIPFYTIELDIALFYLMCCSLPLIDWKPLKGHVLESLGRSRV